MIDIVSGHSAIDRYLARGYEQVRGMSSRFAAAICGHVIRRQSELGISGDIAEIGTFEGRFFIALALGLAPGESALGLDTFHWPDDGVEARFVANCRAHGLAPDRFAAWKADTGAVTADALRGRLGGRAVRFFHIDGDHYYKSLSHDLELAHAVLHESGVICVDDMLHPEYPTLITAVLDYLARHPEMRVLCIVDREDIVAAAKFLICRGEAVALYEQDLMASFRPFHYVMGAELVTHWAVVLTPHPRLLEIG
jgi:hypothetical protein